MSRISLSKGWILTLMMLVLVACAQREPQSAMFRGNPAHTGVFSVPNGQTQGTWEFKTSGRIFSSPVIADGALFVGSTDNHIYAIELADGRERCGSRRRAVSSRRQLWWGTRCM